MRTGTKIEELTVAVESDFFAFGNVCETTGLKLGKGGRFRNQLLGFITGNFEAFKQS